MHKIDRHIVTTQQMPSKYLTLKISNKNTTYGVPIEMKKKKIKIHIVASIALNILSSFQKEMDSAQWSSFIPQNYNG